MDGSGRESKTLASAKFIYKLHVYPLTYHQFKKFQIPIPIAIETKFQ